MNITSFFRRFQVSFAIVSFLLSGVFCRADEKATPAPPSKASTPVVDAEAKKKQADATAACERGLNALQAKRFDSAVAAFSEAIKIKPDEAKYYGLRGTTMLRLGQTAEGLEDVKKAIKLNPHDAGADYRPSSNKELSPEALKHGEEQVRLMLADRPAMAEHAEEAKFLREWAVRKFAGEDLGSLIDWDPTPPRHSDAENLAPENGHHGSILIDPDYDSGPKSGQPRSFEELWAGAVFELHNINFAKNYVALHRRAEEGKVSKTDFVSGIVKDEITATQQTRAFYVNLYLPFAQKHDMTTNPTLWFTHWWPSMSDVLGDFKNKYSYPWNPYARQHDWASVERLFRWRRYDRAIKLLQQMCVESDHFVEHGDHAEVHQWLGKCFLRQGKYDAAVEDLSAAIRIDPSDPDGFELRAQAYQELGEKEKAEADEKRAKELKGR